MSHDLTVPDSGSSGGELAPIRDELTGVALERSRALVWRRTVPLAPDFELVQGEGVFGEMEPANHDGWDAAGECLGRGLELRMSHRFVHGHRVTTRRSDGAPGPEFTGQFLNWGWIKTPEGESLRWRQAFSSIYGHVLLNSRGRELLRLRPTFLRMARTQTRVLVRDAAWARDDLPELILLTWFIRVHVETRWSRKVFRSRD